ncbi:maltose alpha-D-glucosyltransferase/ alpha-amylase [Palleronia marisminoris]|uniref:Trehalose synthase/amylase TreS n=1 Tax=Palleronia marisminoris TaxID=315423 RepID=A0A1Y5SD27_9RHOB|nr:alpha-amylase family protein [Palleronia marisminoris]SFG72941.1 maltose alpha-D-glucosyltransferase/ alpha-amylase [Palleronia marisminoris]SLN37264.1 Trehalose synthase/amylase TreS [Palleronia marisminoris]
MLDLWYKNAIIYCLDVETYVDSNADGIGDFRGLTDRLDHLEALGATAVWLNPFYPSPNRDNGYDITDFYGVDAVFGSPGDFVAFCRAARDKGLRVILDLVVNHTSKDHPWFKSASASRDSPYRDWYVWSDEKPEDITEGIIFPGVQDAVWTYCEATQSWYMHRFYAHQPDLNIANPEVREEIQRIMGFWLELGVSGFRIDAVPFLVEYKGLKEEPERDPLLLLSEMRDFLSWRRAEAILLAEANVTRDQSSSYFGGQTFGSDERMHLIFDFPLNQMLWLALARQDARPIAQALSSRPDRPPQQAQWANFLRNHDELSLDKLSEAERQEVFDAFAPEEDMRIYGRGIRRRLAPMLGGDARRVALAHSLLFALPGTPVMWYGDEIGMGEDLSLPERRPVRTPMQWNDEEHGGFSHTDGATVRPVVADGPLGYCETNVEQQSRRPNSLLKEIQGMIRTRRACPGIGWGKWRPLDGLPEPVLGLICEWRGAAVLTLHNLGDEAIEVMPADLGEGHAITLLSSAEEEERTHGTLTLEGSGYRWFRLGRERR